MADTVQTRAHVLTILTRRELAGEGPVSKVKLQELAGLGMGDLGVAVGILVDEGKLREHADGTIEKVPEPDPVASSVVADGREYLAGRNVFLPGDASDEDVMRMVLAEKEREEQEAEAPASLLFGGVPDQIVRTPARRLVTDDSQPFRLSPVMLRAMTAEALGGVVLAGVAEAEGQGRAFVLVVGP